MSKEKQPTSTEIAEFQKTADFLNASFQEGVAAAIILFIKKNKLKTERGATGLDTNWVFAQHLNAEYPADSGDGALKNSAFQYPFKESLRAELDPVILKESGTLMMLMKNEERETIRKLCRIIAAGAVLNFLDRNSKEAIDFFEGLKAKK